jgi:2-oxoglutarate dehydrogenase E2 component (dihydrolipoamide succinyltransferase)
MKHPVVAPSVGESVSEVGILKWTKKDGQAVKVGEVLVEIESDKATVEIVAEKAGVLQILKQAGERIPIGAQIAAIDDAATPTATADAPAAATQAAPAPAAAAAAPAPAAGMAAGSGYGATATHGAAHAGPTIGSGPMPGPGTRKQMTEAGQNPFARSTGATAAGPAIPTSAPGTPMRAPTAPAYVDRPGDRRVKMSMLRQRIAERLVQSQHTAAILTTFNEVDMSAVMKLRSQHKDAFEKKHGVKLGFMSFFTRASIEALKAIPEVNASIDGGDIVYHDYFDIGVAVGTERGLVVPVIRDAGKMGFVEIEKTVADFGARAKTNKLSINELSGGTFTISNGGTYGSLMSTPIINPPQSGILGMHKIQERPMAIDGKVEIRPMMYVALSYDHRLIDGKGAVTWLVTLKDFLEHPEKLNLTY